MSAALVADGRQVNPRQNPSLGCSPQRGLGSERLGVVPHVRDTFILADGGRADRDIGRTGVRVDGRGELTLVVFGEPDAPTLEGLRLAADPVGRPLIPVPGLLLGSWSFVSPLTLGQLGLQPAIISEHRL